MNTITVWFMLACMAHRDSPCWQEKFASEVQCKQAVVNMYNATMATKGIHQPFVGTCFKAEILK